jgi:hypothetical protein
MSLLSQFLQKPLSGLQQTGPASYLLAPPSGRPVFTIEATDTTLGAEAYPQILLKTDRNVSGSGGAVVWKNVNSGGTVQQASIVGKFNTLTIGNEGSQIDLNVLGSGSNVGISIRGDLQSVVPSVDGQWALGSSSLHWSNLLLGDGVRVSALTPSAIEGTIVGSVSNNGLAFQTAGAVRGRFDTLGRYAQNAAIDVSAMHAISGAHVGSATTLRGMLVGVTYPETTTVHAASYASFPATKVFSFTLPEMSGYYAGDPVKGAGSTITRYYGLRVESAGGIANTHYGAFVNMANASGVNYSFYGAGVAPSFLAGNLGIGDSAPSAPLSVLQATNSLATDVARVTLTGTSYTGNIVKVVSKGSGSGWNVLQLTNDSATNFLTVRGDGVLLIGAGATANNPAQYTSIVGGVNFTATDVYVGGGNKFAKTLTITGSHAIGLLNTAIDLQSNVSITLGGTATYVGFSVNPTIVSSTDSGDSATGIQGSITMPGPGNVYGMQYGATSATGHTGTLTAGSFQLFPASTTGVASAIQGYVGNTLKAVDYGVFLTGVSGAAFASGFVIDSLVTVNSWAFQYRQHAGTTGGLIQMLNSSSANLFKVDVSGNVDIASAAVYKVNATQVVGARVTGYVAMTGTPDKGSTFATSTVTLAQLAGRVMQLQADLTTHGLIGA